MTKRWFTGGVGDRVIVAKDAHRQYRGDVGVVEKESCGSLYVILDRNGRQLCNRESLLPYDPSYVVTDEDRLDCRHEKARLCAFTGGSLSQRITADFNQKHPRANAHGLTEIQEPEKWAPIDPKEVYRHCICGAIWSEVDNSFCGVGVGLLWDVTALVVKRGAKVQEPWQLNDSTCYARNPERAQAYFRKFWGTDHQYEIISFIRTEQWKLNLPTPA